MTMRPHRFDAGVGHKRHVGEAEGHPFRMIMVQHDGVLAIVKCIEQLLLQCDLVAAAVPSRENVAVFVDRDQMLFARLVALTEQKFSDLIEQRLRCVVSKLDRRPVRPRLFLSGLGEVLGFYRLSFTRLCFSISAAIFR